MKRRGRTKTSEQTTKVETVASLIAELEALDDVQARIDRVAADFSSRKEPKRYACLDAWQLGELLGVYPGDAHGGDWHHIQYGYKGDLDGVCDPFPFAENVHLLNGEISEERYEKLEKLAEAILEKRKGKDLPLTKSEIRTLKDEYAYAEHSDCGPTLAVATVCSSKGVELRFEATLSDGHPDGGAWSPYDLEAGDGFDSSDFVMLDDNGEPVRW